MKEQITTIERLEENENRFIHQNSVLFKTAKEVALSQDVCRLVSSRYYTLEDTYLTSLVDVLTDNPSIQAVAVIKRDGNVQGVIIRKNLFNLMSKAYGREVFSRETASSYLEMYNHDVEVFDMRDNIFTVSEKIKGTLTGTVNDFFLVVNRGSYYGIFNSNDLLVYLADITRRDFVLSKQIQSRIVKGKDVKRTSNFAYSAVSVMALDVGGDFYTVKKIDSENYFIALCDVSGKGMAASLVSSMLYGFTNSYNYEKGLEEFVADLNANIFSSFSGDKYVTGVFIIFNEKTGLLTIADMGHSHYVMFGRASQQIPSAEDTNMPLGVAAAVDLKFQYRKMERGDRFFLATDGLLEQINFSGEYYSMEHASSIIAKYVNKDINDITTSIFNDFNTFKNDIALHDDVTFILFEYPVSNKVHENKSLIFSNNIRSQIIQSISTGEPFQVKTSRYHPKTRSFIEEVLRLYLEHLHRPQFEINLAYCIHELATNAKKANLKRIYFHEKGLDIQNIRDYNRGMKTFKDDVTDNLEGFLLKQKKHGYYIVIGFQISDDQLILSVHNNAELLPFEEERIQSRLNAAWELNDIGETYTKVSDDSEGAGLGIVMMARLLSNIGQDKKSLKITKEKGMTLAQINIKPSLVT